MSCPIWALSGGRRSRCRWCPMKAGWQAEGCDSRAGVRPGERDRESKSIAPKNFSSPPIGDDDRREVIINNEGEALKVEKKSFLKEAFSKHRSAKSREQREQCAAAGGI